VKMDQQRFDRLARAMARGSSRRAVFAAAAAASAGWLVRRSAGATTIPNWRVGRPGSFCGGIAGIACPDGYQCVFDSTVCDPNHGGADCGGTCQRVPDNPCAAMLCQQGTDCCPNCGGICVPAGTTCSDNLCQGERCGPNRCKQGEVCCNESCGICTPPGGLCPMIACLPDESTPF
jgi:hypothetical protein